MTATASAARAGESRAAPSRRPRADHTEAGIAAIGSGGNYALAAARALMDGALDAEAIARRAMAIAADICVYTNGNLTVESLDAR